MRVWVRVSVAKNNLYDRVQGESEVDVQTECPNPEQLPWHMLCAGLVVAAMRDYEEKQADADGTGE